LGDRADCIIDINIDDHANVRIAPLILITFIENAFKHAKDSVEQKIHIAIRLWTTDSEICFTILNSHSEKSSQKKNISEASGQGLPNTIRRLELLYPGKYSLMQEGGTNQYYVELKLKKVE
jgi:LytS/YehU family sensor histidine kinase